jgi:hypothetical protein
MAIVLLDTYCTGTERYGPAVWSCLQFLHQIQLLSTNIAARMPLGLAVDHLPRPERLNTIQN